MKKKIRELTDEEMSKICNNNHGCLNCPLFIYLKLCFHVLVDVEYSNKYFDKEVEVDE